MNRGLTVQVGVDGPAVAPVPRPTVTGFAELFRRPASRSARAVLMAVNLAAITAFLLSYSRHGVGFGPYRIDLNVYRMGGQTWWHGGELYGRDRCGRRAGCCQRRCCSSRCAARWPTGRSTSC